MFAKDECFFRYAGHFFRRNQIWRATIDRRTGDTVDEALVKQNVALVKYFPEDVVEL